MSLQIGDLVRITTGNSKAYLRVGMFIGVYVRKGKTMMCIDMDDKSLFPNRVEVLPNGIELV